MCSTDTGSINKIIDCKELVYQFILEVIKTEDTNSKPNSHKVILDRKEIYSANNLILRYNYFCQLYHTYTDLHQPKLDIIVTKEEEENSLISSLQY